MSMRELHQDIVVEEINSIRCHGNKEVAIKKQIFL